MSKAELSFLNRMEHKRLQTIHVFFTDSSESQPRSQMVSPEVVSFQLHTAFQLCAENDLGAWNSSCFPRSNMKCFSCTGKDRFGFWKLTKIPGEIQVDGWQTQRFELN